MEPDRFTSRVVPHPEAPPSADPRRELLERIIASPVFQKSERLRTFLSFICETTFQGREKDLNEQSIGEAVFGRPPAYDSSVDGIVRTQASRLRKRLDLYFAGEGAREPLFLVVPRGGYVPLFEKRRVAALPPESPVPDASHAGPLPAREPVEPPVQRKWSVQVSWTLVAILSLIVVALLLKEFGLLNLGANGAAQGHTLSLPVFTPGEPTVVVAGDTALVIAQGLLLRDIHLAEYLRGDYLNSGAPPINYPVNSVGDLGRRRYAGVIDITITRYLCEIARLKNSGVDVRYARDLRPNDIKQGNVIFLGAAEANPWVELYERDMNFYLVNDRPRRVFSIVNRVAQPGEARQWDSIYGDPQNRVYGIVALRPNLGGTGNVLILEGTGMAGTEAAWDFVSDDTQLMPFLQKIRKRNGAVPHFEVVLGTNSMGASAVQAKIMAWRVAD